MIRTVVGGVGVRVGPGVRVGQGVRVGGRVPVGKAALRADRRVFYVGTVCGFDHPARRNV